MRLQLAARRTDVDRGEQIGLDMELSQGGEEATPCADEPDLLEQLLAVNATCWGRRSAAIPRQLVTWTLT